MRTHFVHTVLDDAEDAEREELTEYLREFYQELAGYECTLNGLYKYQVRMISYA